MKATLLLCWYSYYYDYYCPTTTPTSTVCVWVWVWVWVWVCGCVHGNHLIIRAKCPERKPASTASHQKECEAVQYVRFPSGPPPEY